MTGNNFVYTIYDNRLAVVSKSKWIANRGYVPDSHEATKESLNFLKSLSPNFKQIGECFFSFKGKKDEAIKILENSGVVKVGFGQINV